MKRIRFGIRGRVLAGFLILAAMVVVSGALSIHELKRMSQEVRSMMRDSYRSVQFGQGMLDAQEMENEVLLRFVAGDYGRREEAEREFAHWHEEFSSSRVQAHGNVTHEGEEASLDSVDAASGAYVQAAHKLLAMEQPALHDYMQLIKPAHETVKRAVQKLLTLNQEHLYNASHLIDSFPERSIRPGLIVMIVGVLFALMFMYLISTFYLRPVMQMRDATEGYLRYRDRGTVRIINDDELGELWRAIERLMERCDEKEGRHRGL